MSALTFLVVLLWAPSPAAQEPGPAPEAPAAAEAAQEDLAPGLAPVSATVSPRPEGEAEAEQGGAVDEVHPSPEKEPVKRVYVAPEAEAARQMDKVTQWAFIFGLPTITVAAWWYPILSWAKVISLICFLGWVGSWVGTSIRDRRPARLTIGGARPLDLVLLLAIIFGVGSIFTRVAQSSGRLAELNVAGVPVALVVGLVCLISVVVWIEVTLWSGILRARRPVDLLVLIGLHLALVGAGVLAARLDDPALLALAGMPGWAGQVLIVSSVGLTYMGDVVLLRVVLEVLRELVALRSRRLYAMSRFSWIESFRKTRIPWAVLAIFLLILAFTHWFLQPPDQQRQAELSRLYVGTLMFLSSILLIVMVAVLTPITLPNDIRFQTIYTVVTKPVRRLEVIWGRIFGFMAVVTVLLLFLGAFGGIYLGRIVGSRVDDLEAQLAAAREDGLTARADQIEAQLDQLKTRLSARVPVDGSLTFIDSIGEPRIKGIDVGQEQVADSFLEIRSFVEGATEAKAVWLFGPRLPDPRARLFPDLPISGQLEPISRPVPVGSLLRRGTIEAVANDLYEHAYERDELEAQKRSSGATDLSRINGRIDQVEAEIEGLKAEHDQLVSRYNELDAQARAAASAGNEEEAARLREEAAALRSPDVPVQMTFTVYRTTKGRVGEPVFAAIRVLHPFVPQETVAGGGAAPRLVDPLFGNADENPLIPELVYEDTFDIKEYYTNKWEFPAAMLVGSGGNLTLEVQCLSPTQYLGMAEKDLFLVANQGSFWVNYAKGLLGIWLQAMVLTAIGVFAGTFLSWPVALLITIFFFISGEVFFPILNELASGTLVGGGPFESMIRMVTHENQMTDLDATLGVMLAQSLDAIVVPIMSLLIYIVPNFSAMELGNVVADGFAVTWSSLGAHALLALAYALPFSIAAYFILRNREVAA